MLHGPTLATKISGRQSTDQGLHCRLCSQVTGSGQSAVTHVLTGGRISPLFGNQWAPSSFDGWSLGPH